MNGKQRIHEFNQKVSNKTLLMSNNLLDFFRTRNVTETSCIAFYLNEKLKNQITYTFIDYEGVFNSLDLKIEIKKYNCIENNDWSTIQTIKDSGTFSNYITFTTNDIIDTENYEYYLVFTADNINSIYESSNKMFKLIEGNQISQMNSSYKEAKACRPIYAEVDPTEDTEGAVNQHYINETTSSIFYCKKILRDIIKEHYIECLSTDEGALNVVETVTDETTQILLSTIQAQTEPVDLSEIATDGTAYVKLIKAEIKNKYLWEELITASKYKQLNKNPSQTGKAYRYIKQTMKGNTGNGWSYFGNIYVYQDNINIAEQGTVTADFGPMSPSTGKASGVDIQNWSNGEQVGLYYNSTNAIIGPHWCASTLTLDLGEPQIIDSIRLANGFNGYSHKYKLEISLDGEEWETVYDYQTDGLYNQADISGRLFVLTKSGGRKPLPYTSIAPRKADETDDTKALRRALALAKITTKHVVLDSGVYIISEQVHLPVGVRLSGSGMTGMGTCLRLADNSNCTMIKTDVQCHYVALDNLTIYGNGKNQTESHPLVVYNSWVTGFLRDLVIYRAHGEGLVIGNGAMDFEMTNIWIWDCKVGTDKYQFDINGDYENSETRSGYLRIGSIYIEHPHIDWYRVDYNLNFVDNDNNIVLTKNEDGTYTDSNSIIYSRETETTFKNVDTEEIVTASSLGLVDTNGKSRCEDRGSAFRFCGSVGTGIDVIHVECSRKNKIVSNHTISINNLSTCASGAPGESYIYVNSRNVYLRIGNVLNDSNSCKYLIKLVDGETNYNIPAIEKKLIHSEIILTSKKLETAPPILGSDPRGLNSLSVYNVQEDKTFSFQPNKYEMTYTRGDGVNDLMASIRRFTSAPTSETRGYYCGQRAFAFINNTNTVPQAFNYICKTIILQTTTTKTKISTGEVSSTSISYTYPQYYELKTDTSTEDTENDVKTDVTYKYYFNWQEEVTADTVYNGENLIKDNSQFVFRGNSQNCIGFICDELEPDTEYILQDYDNVIANNSFMNLKKYLSDWNWTFIIRLLQNKYEGSDIIRFKTPHNITKGTKYAIEFEGGYSTYNNDVKDKIKTLDHSPRFRLSKGSIAVPYNFSSQYIDSLQNQINERYILLKGPTAPTENTVAELGQHYLDTTKEVEYVCTNTTISTIPAHYEVCEETTEGALNVVTDITDETTQILYSTVSSQTTPVDLSSISSDGTAYVKLIDEVSTTTYTWNKFCLEKDISSQIPSHKNLIKNGKFFLGTKFWQLIKTTNYKNSTMVSYNEYGYNAPDRNDQTWLRISKIATEGVEDLSSDCCYLRTINGIDKLKKNQIYTLGFKAKLLNSDSVEEKEITLNYATAKDLKIDSFQDKLMSPITFKITKEEQFFTCTFTALCQFVAQEIYIKLPDGDILLKDFMLIEGSKIENTFYMNDEDFYWTYNKNLFTNEDWIKSLYEGTENLLNPQDISETSSGDTDNLYFNNVKLEPNTYYTLSDFENIVAPLGESAANTEIIFIATRDIIQNKTDEEGNILYEEDGITPQTETVTKTYTQLANNGFCYFRNNLVLKTNSNIYGDNCRVKFWGGKFKTRYKASNKSIRLEKGLRSTPPVPTLKELNKAIEAANSTKEISILSSTSNPTETTVGQEKQMLLNTSTGETFICISADTENSKYIWTSITNRNNEFSITADSFVLNSDGFYETTINHNFNSTNVIGTFYDSNKIQVFSYIEIVDENNIKLINDTALDGILIINI